MEDSSLPPALQSKNSKFHFTDAVLDEEGTFLTAVNICLSDVSGDDALNLSSTLQFHQSCAGREQEEPRRLTTSPTLPGKKLQACF